MDIRFRKGPNVQSLCLMTGRFPNWYLFKNSFILHRQTLERFVNFHSEQGFDGKFVFNRKTRKLVLAPGEDESRHSAMAHSTEIEYVKKDIIAAYITFRIDRRDCVFELDDESTFFGEPSIEDFELVADYIRGLFKDTEYMVEVDIL